MAHSQIYKEKLTMQMQVEYSCLSGEGWTMNLPVGSYYAIFNTEYAGFEAINRTITVIPNIKYYINVTPMTTNKGQLSTAQL